MIPNAHNDANVKPPELRYRYAVVEVNGDVPPAISEMLDKPEMFLLYRENRGPESQQDFLQGGRPSGGWYMERRGAVRIRDGMVVEEIPDEAIADPAPEELN